MKNSVISTLVAAALWGPALAAAADAAAASGRRCGLRRGFGHRDRHAQPGRVKARDSAAPITVINSEALQATGATNLRDALERTLPSSLNRQSFGGDLGALDGCDPVTRP